MSRTHITFLIDRSGSMESQADGVRKGFASFVEEQKGVAGECRLTVLQFDDNRSVNKPEIVSRFTEILLDNVDIQDVNPATALEKFKPRGGTPLFDSTAEAIAHTEATLARQAVPDHIIVVIFTDGEENASQRYTYETLSALVKNKEEAGWTFTYLGANHDSYSQSASTGISRGNTQSYAGSSPGAMSAYGSLSASVTNQRTVAAAGVSNTNFFIDKEAEEELAKAKTDLTKGTKTS